MYGVQIGCVVLTLVTISCALEVCYVKQLDGTSQLKTCTYSCCGITYLKYCCGSSSSTNHYTYSLTTGAIIGIAIGVLCLIGLIVGLIKCCVCCCKSTPGQRGQVMPNQHQLIVVSGTTNAAYTPGYGPAPVAYPPTPATYPPVPGAYPPAPAYTQAAYP
ncbi:uncharacterized protein LOC124259912 isoform X5 [Haliotis rubra]|uniref:uncharacterized protein LOC124259912 isoform X5 n=1 Tax=Haliotis rubra TaxID=36100 RepID=UPI001EE5C45B|nr:uncharacterized protein LOC124259912 isoform X5 [Haliotis rubra]